MLICPLPHSEYTENHCLEGKLNFLHCCLVWEKKKKKSLLSAFPETYKVQSKKDGNRHKIEVREKGRG